MLLYLLARQEAENIRAVSNLDGKGLDDLKRIASRWEATVTSLPLEDGLSGFIIKEAKATPRIYINSSEPMVRQRFTLAHEIGHLVDRNLIAKDDDYSFVDRRSTDYDLHEFFADEFAGALLMPEKELEEKSKLGMSDYELAKHFGVSIVALNKRRERLKKNPSQVN